MTLCSPVDHTTNHPATFPHLAVAVRALPCLARLAASSQIGLQKAALQCFASSYPLLFKYAYVLLLSARSEAVQKLTLAFHRCAGTDEQLWTAVVKLKTISVQLWRTGSAGCKLAAVKVIQRIFQTQTKGTADPRVSPVARLHPLLAISD